VELALDWFVRKADRMRHRLNVLIDAQAVLKAVLKGRSSAPSFYTSLRRLGATLLGCSISLSVAYVPSEANPTDKPSRGLPQARTLSVKQRQLKLTQQRRAALWQRLADYEPEPLSSWGLCARSVSACVGAWFHPRWRAVCCDAVPN